MVKLVTAEDFIAMHTGRQALQIAQMAEANQQLTQNQSATLSTLYECVVSGQVEEAGIARLMQDPMFAAYYNKRKGK